MNDNPRNDDWRILQIDDDPDDRLLTESMLSEIKGRKVSLEHAADYAQGVDKLRAQVYDAVLVDYDLGTHTGIDLIRELSAEGNPAPLILFTGRGSYEIDIEAMQAGATLYLTKNEATPLLFERFIRYAIERKQIENRLQTVIHLQEQTNRSLAEERNRLLAVTQAIPVGVSIINAEGRVVLKNAGFEQVWGGPTPMAASVAEYAEFTARSIETGERLQPKDWAAAIAIRDGEPVLGQFLEIERFDGTTGAVINSAVPIRDAAGVVTGCAVAIMDVTELRLKETRLEQLNRTLRALSSSNRALSRLDEEAAYLQEVCRIIVEDCGHLLVWIGMAENDAARSVRPAAFHGFEPEYLDSLQITWADEARGRGPTGTAIRNARTTIVCDTETDPDFEPWREDALRRGYRSIISLPLMSGGEAFGCLNICSLQPDAFSDEEVSLLIELASDLSLGIGAIRARKAHAQSELYLRYLATFPEQNPNPIVEVDLDGKISYMNPSARSLLSGLEHTAGEGMALNQAPDFRPPSSDAAYAWLDGWQELAAGFQNGADPVRRREVTVGERRFHQTIVFDFVERRMRIYGADITERINIEKALRQSEDHLRLALKNLPVFLANIDLDLRYTWVYNPIGGITPEEMIGQPVAFSADADTGSRIREILQSIVLTGSPVEYESESGATGAGHVFHTYAEPLRDPSGEVKGISVIAMDITERKRIELELQRSEELVSKAFNASPDPIVISRIADGKILEVNPAYERLFGYSRRELVGKTTLELNLIPNPADRAEAMHRLRSQGSLRDFEMQIRTRSGELRRVSMSIEKIAAEDDDTILTILDDITEREIAMEALEQQADQLQSYAAELERSNHALEDFTFYASHDLGEPLHKVTAFGDLLKTQLGDSADPATLDYINRMQQAVIRMRAMLQGLLDYSRVSIEGSPYSVVNLNAIAAETVSDMSWRIQNSGGKVEISDLPTVLAVPALMRQLFQNLIGNAFKFQQPGVSPHIRIYSQANTDGTVTVTVADNGVGFDSEKADQLFKPFHRLHSRAEYPGVGMGLAICSKIVALHGGTIYARGEPGKGAEFMVTLEGV